MTAPLPASCWTAYCISRCTWRKKKASQNPVQRVCACQVQDPDLRWGRATGEDPKAMGPIRLYVAHMHKYSALPRSLTLVPSTRRLSHHPQRPKYRRQPGETCASSACRPQHSLPLPAKSALHSAQGSDTERPQPSPCDRYRCPAPYLGEAKK